MADCNCNNFPASLGNVTFQASVGIQAAMNPGTERLVVAGGGVDLIAPALNPAGDAGLGLSFESYGGRLQTFEGKPLVLNPLGNNVGIGSTTPFTERLVVAGGLDLTAPATNAMGDAGLGLSFEAYGGRIQTFESRPLVLNPLGNSVGIGTTSPAAALDVAGTVRAQGILLGGDMLMSGGLKDSTGQHTYVDSGGCHYA